MDTDEWQQHITIDVAITSTDDTAITFIGARDITSIGRITAYTTGGMCIMSIGRTIRYITGAKAITSSGIMCIARRATISTDARAITFIASDMQRRDIGRCTHVGRM